MRIDIDMSFTAHPLTGDLTMKKDRQAAEQSMKNLILTNFYERGFNYVIGSDVLDSLFEDLSPLTMQTLRDNIIQVINNFEPDVEIDTVDIFESGSNEITVNIYYYLTNDPELKSFTIPLQRLR